MMGHQHVWKDQCEAAKTVRLRHGLRSALDYLIGEKLLHFAELAAQRSEFAHELPSFVAEVRSLFSPEELADYLADLDPSAKPLPAGVAPEWLDETGEPNEPAARTARAQVIAELLLSPRLGTA
jgi:hypothetical protein